jgi:endonuclease YncB( thermonuclease family)
MASRITWWIVALALVAPFWPATAPSAGSPASHTWLTLDGVRERVFWNDGDSFRINTGSRKGTRARLSAFNTLESYGPVHFWGRFNGLDLYMLAKKGTARARSEEWVCTTQPGTGGYGRILVTCEDLRLKMISEGLAHLFFIDAAPDPELVAAQHAAQAARRGIWARGVPDFIVTSIHSQAEYTDRPDKKAYNRICNTRTGVADVVTHGAVFNTCDAWCHGGSCMVYVPFEVRYGERRPLCLRRGKENKIVRAESGAWTVSPRLGFPLEVPVAPLDTP